MKLDNIKIGDRVTVHPDRERWVQGAAKNLDGMGGEVHEIKQNHGFSGETGVLVCLDSAPEKWWEHQRPGHAWWFRPGELHAETQAAA